MQYTGDETLNSSTFNCNRLHKKFVSENGVIFNAHGALKDTPELNTFKIKVERNGCAFAGIFCSPSCKIAWLNTTVEWLDSSRFIRTMTVI